MLASAPDAYLVLVGEGPEKDACALLESGAHSESSVRTGGQTRRLPLMATCRFSVMFEGLPCPRGNVKDYPCRHTVEPVMELLVDNETAREGCAGATDEWQPR